MSEKEKEKKEDENEGKLEIVVGISIRDASSGGTQELDPVSVRVDRRSLSNSPVQVQIGLERNMKIK